LVVVVVVIVVVVAEQVTAYQGRKAWPELRAERSD
jgi:hypothetical protein